MLGSIRLYIHHCDLFEKFPDHLSPPDSEKKPDEVAKTRQRRKGRRKIVRHFRGHQNRESGVDLVRGGAAPDPLLPLDLDLCPRDLEQVEVNS